MAIGGINLQPDTTRSSINNKNKKFVLRTRARGLGTLDLFQYMEIFGEEIIDGIEYQAREASRLYDAVPREEGFFKSFFYEIQGMDIAVYSKWEWITKYLSDSDPKKMDWLTKQANSSLSVIPLKDDKGQMIFRTVPLQKTDAWVHPAIKKWTWIEKGVERGINKAINRVLQMTLLEEMKP